MTQNPVSRPRNTMTIGEVLNQLRPEFPDISISKIRFLEAERLIEPVRAPSGYRHFTSAHVVRLRYVLTAQRDHYLPLKVIREHLDAIERGLEPPLPMGRPAVPATGANADVGPGAEVFNRSTVDLRLSRVELIDAADIDDELLTRLEEYNLVAPVKGGHYDVDALGIARAAGELAAFGLEPRHLRPFKTAAEREVGLVEQVVAPLLRQRTNESRTRAEDQARELASAAVRLHTALVRSGVGQAFKR